ncbi:hypothetical protein [Shewanella ulleungensis]|uniref:hypothetical protein n=1 Tax=Shewanella ulleungensis TaxID=2282699 RepID=UPI003D78D877
MMEFKQDTQQSTDNLLNKNIWIDKFQNSPIKSKALLVGWAVIILGLLYSFSGSADTSVLGESFPENGSVSEQCEFLGEYQSSMYRAAVEGVSADEIKSLMNNDAQIPTDFKRSATQYFYSWKKSHLSKVNNLVSSVTNDKFKSKSSSEIEARIVNDAKKIETDCLRIFSSQ